MRQLFATILIAAVLMLPTPAHAATLAHPGEVIFGTEISLTATTVTGRSDTFHADAHIAYAATLSRPARDPWLLLSFSRIYPGRGSQLIERDWIDADEGDQLFADWIPAHVLRPGGIYSISIRENGRTRAYGTFFITRATAEDIAACNGCHA